jgi:AAA+ superfamily predicted ATPase
MSDIKKDIATYIRAKYPLIWIRSADEQRVENALSSIAQSLNMGCRLWTLTSGFTALDGSAQESAPDPGVALQTVAATKTRCMFVLKDFHPFVKGDNPANVPIVRLMKDTARTIKNATRESARCIVFLSAKVDLPEDLQNEVVLLDYPLPDTEELTQAVKDVLASIPADVRENAESDLNMEAVTRAAKGLTLAEATNCFAKSLIGSKKLNVNLINNEKKQIVSRDGLLEWIDPAGGLESVGGLEELKRWLLQHKKALSAKARAFGLPEPKGVVCFGLPGTGKSLSAKACSLAWQRPILRLDFGRLFGGLLGESEENMRKALQIVEAVGDCILFCDEMDKGLGGSDSSGGSTDGGAQLRMLGTFLTWLQEKKSSVFVFATLNKIDGLPPELFRKGRWDEIFFVDLPNLNERKAIWQVHITKRDRKADNFDVSLFADRTEGFSGAEIEACFTDAMFDAFDTDTDVTNGHVLASIKRTVPLSKTAPEKIAEMRAWAVGKARSASSSSVTESSTRFSAIEM